MTLHYREHSNRIAPLLMMFIHGGGVSGWMWEQQIRYFSHYHCIVPDLPEHGQSHSEIFSIESSAEQLLRLLNEKADGRKVAVIGFSLGSQVLLQMLSVKPDVIDFAIINSALVRPWPHAKSWIGPTIRLAHPLIQFRWFSRLQANTLYINDDRFETYYQESRRMSAETLVRVLHENMSFTIPEGFAQAAGKLLITVGEKEKAVMKQSAKDLLNANPNCTGVLFAQTGHGAPLVQSGLFNEMVERWIHGQELPERCLTQLGP